MTPPRIHLATDDDWERVRDLRLRALVDAPDAFGSTLERERAHGRDDWLAWIRGWGESDNALFAAVEEETWVGLAVGSHRAGDAVAHLFGMWVDPRARRRGTGRMLVESVLGWVAERGATALELGVTTTNDGALAFYRDRGFVETGTVERLRDGSELELQIMRRPLP